MNRLLPLGCLVLGLAVSAQAADPGTTSANFLKLGIGPRAVAMGEAQVGLANDVYATYWNPAGLAQLQNREAGMRVLRARLLARQQEEADALSSAARKSISGSVMPGTG